MKKIILTLCISICIAVLLCGCESNSGDTADTSGSDETQFHIQINGNDTTSQNNSDSTSDTTSDDMNTESDTSAEQPQETLEANGKFEEGDCQIDINDVSITVGMDFTPYIDKLGEHETEEGQACLEGGYDTNYYYGDDFAVYTYASGGKQIVYDIFVKSGKYTTAKGAQVGKTTRDEITAMYGEPSGGAVSTMDYSIDGSNIVVSFTFDDDILESIDIIDESVN